MIFKRGKGSELTRIEQEKRDKEVSNGGSKRKERRWPLGESSGLVIVLLQLLQ